MDLALNLQMHDGPLTASDHTTNSTSFVFTSAAQPPVEPNSIPPTAYTHLTIAEGVCSSPGVLQPMGSSRDGIPGSIGVILRGEKSWAGSISDPSGISPIIVSSLSIVSSGLGKDNNNELDDIVEG